MQLSIFYYYCCLFLQAPNPRSLANSPGSVPGAHMNADLPASAGVAPVGSDPLPPPVQVMGTLIVRGKFDFNSVSIGE